MHDVANITYSFMFLTDEHGCLLIIGLNDLHGFSRDCKMDPWALFDGPIDSSHITHLVYAKPEEALEILGPVVDALKEKRDSHVVVPAYLIPDMMAAAQTGESPPGWFRNEQGE